MSNFSKKIISSKSHHIQKFQATDINGDEAYYFVMIEPHNEIRLNKALENPDEVLNFEDYGKIIASCYGKEPTEEVKKFLKKDYGFDL